MLRHAVSAPKSIAVAVLDVAKAFDSVNHDTLLRAAVTHAAPPLLLNLLSSSYSRTTTQIFDTEVRCLRGVRQGDPLSPLLFSCALSEAISYSDRQLGFELDGVTVDCIAYADDLVLFSESPHRLQQRLFETGSLVSHAWQFSYLFLSADDCIQCSPQKSLQYEQLPLSLLPSLVYG
ncbi:hypothetical protein AAHC03_025503 [Spirometra sp. Aus1]